jgi:NAD(P)-dependent dehydrogenase (short-subunit alcohol dehydrogenase family)
MSTVLITGAGRGLGLELTRQYLAEGWQVIGCARAPDRAAELKALAERANKPGAKLDIEALDVTDHLAINALAAKLTDRAIDVLLNCAGTMGAGSSFPREGFSMGKFGASDFKDWEMTFRINIIGPMKMAEAFTPHVAKSDQKKIVSLTSILGSIAGNKIGGLYAYRASKAALNAIMRSMSIDLARSHNIIATPLHPGWVRTDMGGPRADIDAVTSASGMRAVIAGLDMSKAGRYWMYNGEELPW